MLFTKQRPVKNVVQIIAVGLIPVAVIAAAGVNSARQPGQPDIRPTTETANCATKCHQAISQRPIVHGPINQDVCMVCHTYEDPQQHAFKLTTDSTELCTQCHTLDHKRVTHVPVAEGSCMECHDPHGSEHEVMLVADRKRDLCMQCHVDTTLGKAFVHGPVANGACVLCHEPHSSNQDFLLSSPPNYLCQTCHSEIKTEPEVGLNIHGALEQGCTQCHNAHASDHQFQLKSESPELCLSCHDYMRETIAGEHESVVHGPLRDGGGCAECHNPHSSRLPNLQRESQPQLCLQCHDREIKLPDKDGEKGATLTNISALLAANPNHHGPIRDGLCTACHQPHASDHFRLLLSEYPAEFYAPFELQRFTLCFSCHVPDLVLTEKAKGLTDFRNGDQNLHFLHVNREKGRTCRACQEVHASKQKAHIRESVPFGSSGWMLEINFKPSAEGGSCAPACHKVRAYDRENPVVIPIGG